MNQPNEPRFDIAPAISIFSDKPRMKPATRVPFILFGVALAMLAADGYRKPPQAVLDILNSPSTPTLSLNPTTTYAIQGSPVRYPPIAELAMPMRRLAGIRINPLTNGLHNATFNSSLILRRIREGTQIKIVLPPKSEAKCRPLEPQWQALRLHQLHRKGHRYLGRRSGHRQDSSHRGHQSQRRLRSHWRARRQWTRRRPGRRRRPVARR